MRSFYPAWILLLLVCFFCGGCSKKYSEVNGEDHTKDPADAALAKQRQQAALVAASLDDRLLAAQVIISGIDGRERLGQDMRTLLNECPAGGVMLFRYNLDTDTEGIQDLIAECVRLVAGQTGDETAAGIPPFVAVDHEGGSVNRFKPGLADMPSAGSYWTLAQNEGRDTAIERIEADSFRAASTIKRLGYNLNLAPVAEILVAENSDFLDDRSYGPDPVFTGEAAAAFIRGMERAGFLCVVKHFPGSAGPDPHRFPSVLQGDKAALMDMAAPFAFLIRGGQARALMVSHSALPALDSEIASLSPAIMDGWLRKEMGFTGIIISDDFSMAAAASSAEAAAVKSLASGADMVLVWPPGLRRTHRAIQAALANGSLSRQGLREAAERIIFEKIRMGLIDGE